MDIRIGIAGLWHETNVYATPHIGTTRMAQFSVRVGGSILERYANTRSTIGGAIASAESAGALVIPLVAAEATPSGTIAAATYRSLKSSILSAVASAGRLDGLFLDLHGAGVAQGVDDLEADLGRSVRTILPKATITSALDLHANIDSSTVDSFDAVSVYTRYPHTDTFERGYEAVETLMRVWRGEIRPITRVRVLPMQLPPLAGWTDDEAMRGINEELREIERRDGVVECRLAHGFPYAPGPLARTSVMAISDGEARIAERAARDGARVVWERRRSLAHRGFGADEAIVRARDVLSKLGGPVVLHEANDNPGAGTFAEGTHLLRALLATHGLRAAIGPICDPEAAAAAHRAGLGTRLSASIGAHIDRSGLSGESVPVEGDVIGLSDGRFHLRAMGAGLEKRMGPMAALRVGSIDVVLASKHDQAFDPGYFETVGIDVSRVDIVGVKSIHHFKAGFGSIMTAAIPVDGPGLSQVDVRALGDGWRGTWPWDDGATYGDA